MMSLPFFMERQNIQVEITIQEWARDEKSKPSIPT